MSLRSRLVILLLFTLLSCLQAQGQIRQSEGWLVGSREHQTVDYLQTKLGTPNTPLGKEVVAVATVSGATGEVLVVGPVGGDAKFYASLLRDWEAKFGERAPVEWSQEDDSAAARLTWAHGEMWSHSRSTTLPIGELVDALRKRVGPARVVMRTREFVQYEASPTYDSGKYRYFDVTGATPGMTATLRSSTSRFAPLVFLVFVALVPLSVTLGLVSGWLIATRSSLPLPKRRKLYSKVVTYSAFGSIGLHAPLALFVLTSGALYPITDLWFGSSSSAGPFLPLLMGPVVVLMLVVPIFTKMEKRLFGATPEDGPPLPPPPSNSELSAPARTAKRVSIAIQILGVAIWATALFALSPKSEARSGVQMLGLLTFFAGGFAHRWGQFRAPKSQGVSDDDANLEAEVRELAAQMGVTATAAALDRSAIGLQTASASASLSGRVRMSARAYQILGDAERRFILAHELAHLKLGHGRTRVKMVFVPYGLLALPLILFPLLVVARVRLPVGVGFGSAMVGVAYLFFFGRRLMKAQEFEADRLALEVTRDKDAAESALWKMAMGSAMPHAHDLDENSTHPALSLRIKNLRLLAETGL